MNFNPNDWYQTRRVDRIPQHFTLVDTNHFNESIIESWILSNTVGRYAFGRSFSKEFDSLLSIKYVVAFEDPQDATYFVLMKDSIIESNLFDLF